MNATHHDAFVRSTPLPRQDEPLPAAVRIAEGAEPWLGLLATLIIVVAAAAAALT